MLASFWTFPCSHFSVWLCPLPLYSTFSGYKLDDTIIILCLPGWSPSIKTISLAILILSETFALSCATYSAILEVRIWTTLRAVILPATAFLFMWLIRRGFSVQGRKERRIGLKNKAKSRCELSWRLGSAWVQMKAQKNEPQNYSNLRQKTC